MKVLTLKSYMGIRGIKVAQLAKEIGRSRQIIDYWLANNASVELMGNGIKNIKISKEVFSQSVLHESQVLK